MDWLGTQALAFGREVGEWRFDSVALAEEIGLTVKLTRFRIERKNWFDRASCPPVRQLQRQLESGLQNFALLRGIGSGHPDAPLALGVETLAYRSRARMIAIALG